MELRVLDVGADDVRDEDDRLGVGRDGDAPLLPENRPSTVEATSKAIPTTTAATAAKESCFFATTNILCSFPTAGELRH